ncbi:HlyD family efflux transporter periplasmic adaptor subunit [Glaciecola sp. MH2013]|uniref:efflux RND transporter periplasmic adaptor subunit n=1 Tax=Glaciecola sp. MH2013 TaxID=2785524 RepID=UPI00189FD588|nr:HlyD family efflux transporter periplasmic adaptor subunit [Glaciecola sp. MH2013]MBF7074527.1 HlyD family efflux transporter periplasmic adaptor subunit [Glaciecola sp. MH2013]
MDIVRTKSASGKRKKVIFAAFFVLVLSSLIYFFVFSNNATHRVSPDMLLTSKVEQGELAVTVRGIGVLAPRDVRWLATNVSGKVERILVKAGALVQKGDLILQLSNPELQQRLEETRWEVDELQAQTKALQVSLESEALDQEARVINEKLNYERSLLTLTAQNTLLEQGINAVSAIDHEAIKIEVAQNKQRWELEIKRLAKQKENVEAQMLANSAKVNRMRKTLERVQQQVESLEVRASIDAIVQAMPMELGQQINAGTNLARLAKRDEFIAELRVPEIQIQEVLIGQTVTLETRNSRFEGIVKRIDPSVNNGSVQVDVEISGSSPQEARPELTVEGSIEIVRIPNTLFVRRPMFAKSYGDSYVYLLDENEKTANKHAVTFGKASATYIEIKEGLSLGQKVIISDVSNFEVHQQISIN